MAPCCSASYYCNEDPGESTYSDKGFVGSTGLEVLAVINWPWGFGGGVCVEEQNHSSHDLEADKKKGKWGHTEAQLHGASLAWLRSSFATF